MKRIIFILLIIVSSLIVFSGLVFASDTINVKDYIKGKLPPTFSFQLSSLDDLDSYEKEFIDLLEKLPKKEQEFYAKEVCKNGFSRELLEVAKEGKEVVVYAEAYENGLKLIEKREYKNALSYLEIASKTDILSLKTEVYYAIGLCYGKLNSYKKAIGAYKQATRIYPNHIIAHYNLGVAYYKIGLNEDAIEQYNQAISINPDYADAYYGLGLVYYKLGFNEDAIEQYRQAIRINPGNDKFYCNLGVSYYSLGFYEDAIDAFKQAVNINPGDVENHYDLGGIYHLIGDRKSALNEYEILKKLDINEANKLFGFING